MKRFILLIIAFLAVLAVQAQLLITGVVEDSTTNKAVKGASVTLVRHGKPLKFTRTDQQGQFRISVEGLEADDSLLVSSLGYAKTKAKIAERGATKVLMTEEAFELNEVTVKGRRILGRQDTTVYDLTRFANERDNSLKDVLRKLPGVEVGDGGELKVNGKALSRFTVEGLDLTGGRYNQLEENIKAKDVKNAEIINHDQPIKALEGKVLTDAVAMNIVLKDDTRDKLLSTLRPHLLVGKPTHPGGSANILQIGKNRHWMYGLAYDRTGRDLSTGMNVLTSSGRAQSQATLPQWFSTPSIYTPIDAERLRFNTSQRYGASRIQKLRNDGELRFTANYLRTVERQETMNESVYDFGAPIPTTTSQKQHLTLRHDLLTSEIEHKVNTQTTYGKDVLEVSASQVDALSVMNDSLTQRIRTPQIDVAGSLYRLFTVGKGQLSVQTGIDFHHSNPDLYINDGKTRLKTNLWHLALSAGWLRKRLYLTQQYSAGIDVQNLNTMGNNTKLSAYLTPFFQYERGKLQAAITPRLSFERLTHQQRSFLLWQPSIYLKWKAGRRSEWTLTGSYSELTGQMSSFALSRYQQNYRTFYENEGLMPQTSGLFATLDYVYKRPIKEFFFNSNMTMGRNWRNTITDFTIADGKYYLSMREHDTQNDYWQAEASVSKGFYDLHLKTRLGGSFIYANGQQLADGNLLKYHSRTYDLMPNIEFSPAWGALSYQGRFSWSNTSAMTTLFGWKHSLSLTSTFGAIDLTCAMTHYRNELQQGNSVNTLLADAKAVWRMEKIRISLYLTNLFNKKEYIVSQITGISSSTDYYHLRGCEILLSLQYSL